ncbi:MAG: hypothetical protein DI534_08620 [Leifsonia xyli]|nr:MAG: hypothetical protein DI534_08620 [Leifsonia xyli]
MRTRIRQVTLIAAALAASVLGVLIAAPSTYAADDDITWGVVPSTPNGPDGREAFDYAVAAGTVISDWVSVTNYSTQAATFRVYAADATTDFDTGAFTLIGSERSSDDLGAWTSINGAASTCPDETPEQQASCPRALGVELTLQPGQRADIPFTVTVPYDAAPGDHAAGIVASNFLETPGGDGANIRQETRQGTRIYLRVDGPIEPALTVSGLVSGFAASWIPFAPGTGRVDFTVANTGNVRLTAEPRVRLTGPFGIVLGTWELPAVANLLPGKTAHVGADLPGIPSLLLVTSEVTVVPTTGDGGTAGGDVPAPRYTGSTTAWAVPWTGLALIVVLGGGTALLVWWRRRSRVRLALDLAAYREHILAEDRATRADTTAPTGGDR